MGLKCIPPFFFGSGEGRGVGVAKSLTLCEGALKMYDRSKGEQSDFKLLHMPHPRFVRE